MTLYYRKAMDAKSITFAKAASMIIIILDLHEKW